MDTDSSDVPAMENSNSKPRSKKKRRSAARTPVCIGQLKVPRGWERDERFVRSLRRKIAVARRELAEGRTLDGETAMREILAELARDARAGSRTPKRVRRPRQPKPT